jgi:hypothetical protein
MIQVCLLLLGTAFGGGIVSIGSNRFVRPNAKHAKARNPSSFSTLPFCSSL